MSEQSTSDTDRIEDPYTVEKSVVNVEGETGRPEVFIEATPKSLKPHCETLLVRNSDAMELYRELENYLKSEGILPATNHLSCGNCNGDVELVMDFDDDPAKSTINAECQDCGEVAQLSWQGDPL